MATSDSPLSVPNVTLAVARTTPPPVPGMPSISSVTDNGDGTLTISGSNFGSKAQAAPVLVDYGDTAYEYGVENTFNASQPSDTQIDNTAATRLWASVVSGQLIAGGRAAGQSRIYRVFGDEASLREPFQYELTERQDGNRQMYFGAWVRYKQNSLHHRMTTDEHTIGTFVAEEVISINNGEFVGYYAGDISEPLNFVHSFRFDSSSEVQPTASQLYGKTLVGQTSGASLTFPSEANWQSAYSGDLWFVRVRGPKIARVWDETDGNALRSSYSSEGAYLVSGTVQVIDHFEMRDFWRFVEIEVDLTADGYWGYFVDRTAKADISQDFSAVGNPAWSVSLEQFGIEGGLTTEQETDISEVYFDKTRQRVYLGNASTFTACTHMELQRPTEWSDGSVKVARRDGALPPGKWAYVVGPKGLVNETGVTV